MCATGDEKVYEFCVNREWSVSHGWGGTRSLLCRCQHIPLIRKFHSSLLPHSWLEQGSRLCLDSGVSVVREMVEGHETMLVTVKCRKSAHRNSSTSLFPTKKGQTLTTPVDNQPGVLSKSSRVSI